MCSLPEVAHKKAKQKSKIRRMSLQEGAKAFGLVQASYERFVFFSNLTFNLTIIVFFNLQPLNILSKKIQSKLYLNLGHLLWAARVFLYRPYKHSKAYKEIP